MRANVITKYGINADNINKKKKKVAKKVAKYYTY